MDSETLATLMLQRLPEFGSGGLRRLRTRFGSAENILQAPFDQLTPHFNDDALALIRDYQALGESSVLGKRALRDRDWLAVNDIAVITLDHPEYPALLAAISQPPALLYVRGKVDNLHLPQMAIVGSRNPSPSGRDNAFEFARQLGRSGFAVTSGLALGVDGAAHRGALAADGPTVAVLGTGIDQYYPRRHRQLADSIVASGGTLVSEFPVGTTAQAAHFPRRNRIISGLSLGVLVVEAAIKSGSLITARYALQQNREVFAIPGSIHNPVSRGCHALLREGATLVEQAADMEEPLRGLLSLKREELEAARPATDALAPDEKLVLTNIGFEPTDLDRLAQRTGLPVGQITAALINLELKGWVAQGAGGYQRLQAAEA